MEDSDPLSNLWLPEASATDEPAAMAKAVETNYSNPLHRPSPQTPHSPKQHRAWCNAEPGAVLPLPVGRGTASGDRQDREPMGTF